MSNIYIQEPPTSGKVMLQTTVGDIDIELWSKETPKACRNFVQLCMENYYNGSIFHRVVKGFIAQGGDPEGTGTGGESIYGKPFKDEFHSRLRFVRRGLVAMANGGKDDNGSQFFFTLGASPELQNKHTIFGKVTGNTLYNMLKLEEGLVDTDDRPLYPHKIITCKILSNPFSDIIPRNQQVQEEVLREKCKVKVKKNFNLLSFGEEAEEEEAEVDAVVQEYRGKSKSSHDLTKDPKLSSVSASALYENGAPVTQSDVLENIRKKLKKDDSESVSKIIAHDSVGKEIAVDKEREEVRRQIKQLKKELSKKKSCRDDKEEDNQPKEQNDKTEEEEENALLAEFHKQAALHKKKSSLIPPKGEERQKKTLEMLAKFQNKLCAVKTKVDDDVPMKSDDEDADDNWLAHKLQFEDQEVVVAKDANMPAEDRYDITDPRNPINQRRRHEKKHRR